jgi:thiamine transport system permease protein
MWLIPAVFLLVFLVFPLSTVAGNLTITSLADTNTWFIAGIAIGQAVLSVMAALAVGLPIAAVVTRYRIRGSRWTLALVTIPFVLPTVVVALAFRSVTGSTSGLAIVIAAHAYINIAVVVRVVGATWSHLDDRLAITSASLGANPWHTWWRVTVPQLKPALLAASAIVFLFSFTSLGIVLILGDRWSRTLELQVLRNTSLLLDFGAASAAAFIQLILVAVVVIWLFRRPLATRLPRDQRAAVLPWQRRARVRIVLTLLIANAIVLAPLMFLLTASLRSSSGWTLQWWMTIGNVDAGTNRLGSPLQALWLSLILAVATGILAAAIGGAAAIATLGKQRIIAAVTVLPLGISAATLGLGTLLAFGRPPFDLRSTGLLIPIAHALVAIPLVVAVVAPTLRATDRRLIDVASSLGAAPTRAFWTAYGPVLRVVMIAAGGLAAAVSLGEFGAASFLGRPGSPTVPVQIARLLSRPGEQSYGVAAALAVLLVLLTLLVVTLVDRLGRRVAH